MKKNLIFISMIIILSSFASAIILEENHDTGDSAIYGLDDNQWGAQGFKHINSSHSSYFVNNITIEVNMASGTCTNGNIELAVQSDNAGEPSGTDLGTKTIVQTVTTAKLNVTWVFDTEIELLNDTLYWFVSKGDCGDDGRVIETPTSSYPNGDVWYTIDSGSSWTERSGFDMNFKIEGNYTPSNAPPTITLDEPSENNTHTNSNPINISFLMTNDDATEPTNCTATIDVKTATYTGITNNTIFWVNLSSPANGTHTFSASCTDGAGTTTTGSYNIVYDAINPIINTHTPKNDNLSLYYENLNNSIYFNATFEDSFLWGYNATAYYPNGSVWWNNVTINLTGTNYNFLRNETITGEVEGTYQICYYVEDDHTAKEIGEYQYTKDIATTELAFDTDKGEHITTKLKSSTLPLADIDVYKHTDRYSYTYYMNDLAYIGQTYEYVFKLSSSSDIYYRGNLYPFPSFVTGQHWVDFKIDTPEDVYYEVKATGQPNNWEIKIITKEINLKFESLGGLNNATACFDFEIETNDAPNITSTTPATQFINPAVVGTNIVFTTTATDDEGEAISYEYFWNGTLNHTGNSFTFTVPNSTGIYNMTVNVSDPHGFWSNYTWSLNISESSFMTIQANSLYDDGSLTNFSAYITNSATPTFDDNNTGTITTDLATASSTDHNVTIFKTGWFNQTYYGINPSINISWTALIYQNILNPICYDILNNSVTCVTPVYVDTGVQNVTYQATGYYNITQEETLTGLENRSTNVTGLYSTNLTLQSTSGFGSLTTCNYSITNTTLGYSINVIGSPNSSVGLINGSWNISATCDAYSIANEIVVIENTTQTVTFNIFSLNSLNITFKDILTDTIMNETNITIQFIGTTAQTNITSTGLLYVDLFTPDTYTLIYDADGYRQGKYIISIANRSITRLTLYMQLTNDTQLILLEVQDKFGTVINGAQVTIQRWINDAWATDQIVQTDFQGRSEAYYILSTVFYNHVIQYNDIIYFGAINDDDNKKIIYAEDVTDGLKFTIDILGDAQLPSYQDTFNPTYTLTYINTSNTTGFFRFFWSSDGNQFDGKLKVVKGGSNSLICSNSTTTATGTLFCFVNQSTGRSYYTATGSLNGFVKDAITKLIGQRTVPDFGNTGYIMAFFGVVVGVFIFIGTPLIGLWFGAVIFIVFGLMGLIFKDANIGIYMILLAITYLVAGIKSKSGVES